VDVDRTTPKRMPLRSLVIVLSLLPTAGRAEISVDASRFSVESWAGVDRNGDNALPDDEGDRKVTERSDVLSFSGTARSSDPPSQGAADQTTTISASGTTVTVFATGSCEGRTKKGGPAKEAYGSAYFDVRFTLTAPARVSVRASLEASENGRASVGHPLGGMEVVGGTDSISEDAVLDPGTYFASAVCGADAYFYPGSSGGIRAADARYSVSLSLTEDLTRCEGQEVRWAGGRSGAFGDPENWDPQQVPAYQEGGACDTALFDGGGRFQVDFAPTPGAASGLAPRGALRRDVGRVVVRSSRGAPPRSRHPTWR
jgi:hypothetical protein